MIQPVYDHHGQRVYCGDAMEVMAALEASGERFDLILTSPPYNLGVSAGGGIRNIGLSNRWSGQAKASTTSEFAIRWPAEFRHQSRGGTLKGIAHGYGSYGDDLPMSEYVKWQHSCLLAMWRLLDDDGAIFYNHKPRHWGGRIILPTEYMPADLMPFHRQEVILRRNSGVNSSETFYMPSHERLEIIAKQTWRLRDRGWTYPDVWDMPIPKGNPHPAPFDLTLPKRALATTGARRVLDPFMGSGTTLVAAQALGANGVGIDLFMPFCELAVARLGQPPLDGFATDTQLEAPA